MSATRGREGRLKHEYAELYPGVEPGVWLSVETLIRHVTDLIHQNPSRSAVITGPRLLQQDHFDYRGRSARPEGLPEGATRLSDSGVDPGLTGRAASPSHLSRQPREDPQND